MLSDPHPKLSVPPGQRKRKGEGEGFGTWNALSAASQGHVGGSCILASFGVRPIVCRQEREKKGPELYFHFHSGQPFMGVA